MLLNKNKLKGIVIIILVFILIIFSPRIASVNKRIGSKYTKIKNKNIKIYLSENENKISNSCLNQDDNVKYYTSRYSSIINIIYNLEKKGYLKKEDRKILFKILKEGNVSELIEKINSLNLNSFDNYSLSKKNLTTAITYELGFYDYRYIEQLYKKSIENNKFDIENYIILAEFYRRNCKYDEAINILLSISSIANNSNQKIDISKNYCVLGDLYLAKRDYENALANYINSLVVFDFRNDDAKKANILIKIGDIMSIRGNIFESINYYKYALSLGKLKTKDKVKLLIKLSDSYYTYGNYEVGLKFAKEAESKSKKQKYLYYHFKAKYLECLNYEYLSEGEKAAKACKVALEEAEIYKEQNNNFYSYIALADMLDFSVYIRNPVLAADYVRKAGMLINNENDIYKKLLIMEKLSSILAYNSSAEEKFQTLNTYNTLDKLYKQNNIGTGCCNSILSGFIKEQLNIYGTENDYKKAEVDLKNRKIQLATLYIYLSDYYKSKGYVNDALKYAEMALEIDSQIYRFDHHYIRYVVNKIDSLKNIR